MRFILIHPNFPAQLRNVAEFLGKNPNNEVIFITANPRPEWEIPGVKKIIFDQGQTPDNLKSLPLINFANINTKAEAVVKVLVGLRKQKFIPDLIIGHSGWGTTLYIKDVFPESPFLGYFEWYYDARSMNTGFGSKIPPNLGTRMGLRNKSLPILSDLAACDHGICPTQWQKSQFPKEFHQKLSVIHDGINPKFFTPGTKQKLKLPDLDLTGAKELVTYTARGFEPYRGFPQFIQSIPHILEKRPDAHIVIVGEDRVCYGHKLPNGQTYKTQMIKKVSLDPERVHFIDPLPYGLYLQVLQSSTVHVYLTVPFVLSWSMLEAMSCECLVVASDTPPVKEVIHDGVNGILTDFFSPEKIAEKVVACLEYPSFMETVKKNARKTILEKYSLDKMLSRQINIMMQLTEASKRKKIFG